MGFTCMHFRGLFLPSWKPKLSKEGTRIQSNNGHHLHFKTSADRQMMAQGPKEKFE